MKVLNLSNANINEIDRQVSGINLNKQADVSKTVSKIIQKVKKEGLNACLKLTEKFDKTILSNSNYFIELKNLKTSEFLDQEFKQAFLKAKNNITSFHQKQKNNSFIKNSSLFSLQEKWVALDSVGCYVPGGTAPLISTILMTVIPAKLAGVKSIIISTPPSKDGGINPYILYACKELGVDKILKFGGAQAISAMAFGLPNIKKVDKIVGPGNIFVTEAKKQLFGIVDIDMLAGPSEICIIADNKASANFIASDILSQLEHDKEALATIITNSKDLIKKVQNELKKQTTLLSRKNILDFSRNNITGIIINKIEDAKKVSDIIAPEHLEIMVDNAISFSKYPFKAGVVFIGEYTPVAVGDFYGGTNHVLPTGKRAAFSSSLSVYDFFRRVNYLHYSKEKLLKEGKYIKKLAEIEGLDAHLKSISIRLK